MILQVLHLAASTFFSDACCGLDGCWIGFVSAAVVGFNELHLLLRINLSLSVCPGVDATPLSDVAQGHLGGQNPSSGPEHPASSDRGLRHPCFHTGAHGGARC